MRSNRRARQDGCFLEEIAAIHDGDCAGLDPTGTIGDPPLECKSLKPL